MFNDFYNDIHEVEADTYFANMNNIEPDLYKIPSASFLLKSVLFHIAGYYYKTLGYSDTQAIEAAFSAVDNSFVTGAVLNLDDYTSVILPDGYEIGELYLYKNGNCGIKAAIYDEEQEEYIYKRYTFYID